jgi:hypothetical protein
VIKVVVVVLVHFLTYICVKDDADAEYQEAEAKWEEKIQQEQKEFEIEAEKFGVSPAAAVASPLKNAVSNESPVKPAKNRMSILDSWSHEDDKIGWF